MGIYECRLFGTDEEDISLAINTASLAGRNPLTHQFVSHVHLPSYLAPLALISSSPKYVVLLRSASVANYLAKMPPSTTYVSRETMQKVSNVLTWFINLICVVLLILGLTILKPKCTPVFEIHPSVVVAQDGSGQFTTVSAAVAAAPSHSRKPFGIFIKPGVYYENVRVPEEKTRLAFIGAGMGVTVISSNRSKTNISEDGAATLEIKGEGFVAIDLSLENSGDPTTGYTVSLANDADRTAFHGCSFKGHKGVVKAGQGSQFYGNSHIYGVVDVIWGNAAAVFQKCVLYAEKGEHQQPAGALTFQKRSSPLMKTGFVFHGCSVAAAPGSADQTLGSGSSAVFLARPGGPFSRVVFMECYLGGVLDPAAGWLSESLPPPTTVYLGEYNNGGPGTDFKKRITSAEAAQFTVRAFIEGDEWLPKTTVPHVSGFF
ncbi:hypothetical protein H6P81_018854 [Aristolochia fimbriata]|uniref:Pectinesterase catalytic domain-containing protein n=1 Tax=Aristolochia fimbriata TaxID=158543 RepID=A0AAV7E274_ARIFI|nr:hypothetical protein H6P81_018854 [Aristolochia fimbriata]